MFNIDKLSFKLMRISDIPRSFQLLRQPSAEMLSDDYGDGINEEMVENVLEARLKSGSENNLYFLVSLKKSNEIIGYLAITKINWIKGHAEVSTLVSEKLIGVGYGALISQFALKLCFEELNLIKVAYKVRKDNTWVPGRVNEQLIREVPVERSIVHSYYHGEITK